MLTLDRPSPMSSPDYRRLYCEERVSDEDADPPVSDETAALLCWLRNHAPKIAEAQRSLAAINADVSAAVALQDALSGIEHEIAALRVEVDHA